MYNKELLCFGNGRDNSFSFLIWRQLWSNHQQFKLPLPNINGRVAGFIPKNSNFIFFIVQSRPESQGPGRESGNTE